MTTEVRQPVRLAKQQIPQAGEVLGRAFNTNPGFVWMFPDDKTRLAKLTWFMARGVKAGDRTGEVYTTSDTVEGAAVWLPPGRTRLSPIQMIAAGFLPAPLTLGMGSFLRFMNAMNRFEHLHNEAMPGEHWYLMILGVDPPRQGQGIGSALLQPVLRKADEGGLPCYLETDKPEDVGFYQKHGFEVLIQENMPKGGPPFWTMRRPERA